jgi:prokaryotic ubiquitin-like protein Pup
MARTKTDKKGDSQKLPQRSKNERTPNYVPRHAEPQTEKLKKKGEELTEELDELVEEIDEVLEENAEEFVKNYVQRGGE